MTTLKSFQKFLVSLAGIITFSLLPNAFLYAKPAEIIAIDFKRSEKEFDIIINGQGDLRYTASFIRDPLRIELLFVDTKFKMTQAIPSQENDFIHEVVATMLTSPESDKTARITIDLKSEFQYAVEGAPDGIIIHLFDLDRSDPTTSSGPVETELIDQPIDPPIDSGNEDIWANISMDSKNDIPMDSKEDIPVDASYDELVIGPEDLLDISVFQLPEFSLSARVLGDGTITMPLVGGIKLAGLTRNQAELAISRALTAKQVNRPSVSVTIKEYKSRQVSVLGSVRNAGIYYLTSSRTLLQLLSEAGGLTTDAGTTCYVFRGSSKVMVDLHDLMQNGKQELNIAIQPGDVVNVPSLTRTFVYVLGAVRSPGAVEFIPSVGLTLAAAIARAGGPSRLANLSNIQIKRKDQAGVERVIKANLKDIISNKVPDITLLADDLINVPESFF